jgi:hypothetical protein
LRKKRRALGPRYSPFPDAGGAAPCCLGARLLLFFGVEVVLLRFVDCRVHR